MLKLQLDDFYQGLVDSGDFDDEVLEKIGEHVAIGIELVNNENLFIKQVNQWKKKNYDSFLDIIAFLPNHILAEFARFLISIVSSRRKFSLDLENVGGEIDVCIVTKNQILLND